MAIEEAVETADNIIICLSGNSVTKEGYVQKEMRYAQEISLEKPEGTIFLIPLRLEDCEAPRGLRFFQWTNYFDEYKEQGYKDLLESLRIRLNEKIRIEADEAALKGKEAQFGVEYSSEVDNREKLGAMSFLVRSASLSDRARAKQNKDFVCIYEPVDPQGLYKKGCLYIVADGGASEKGERASEYVAQKVCYEYYRQSNSNPQEYLPQLIWQVNDEVFRYSKEQKINLTTTIVAVLVFQDKLFYLNVGNTRAYMIRSGDVVQLTRDHSTVGGLIQNRVMTEAEARASMIVDKLTRSIGLNSEVVVDTYSPIPLKTGDKILLCTDGLTRYALREDINYLVSDYSPEESVKRLILFAEKRGGDDNVSAVVITIGQKQTELVSSTLPLLLPNPPSLALQPRPLKEL